MKKSLLVRVIYTVIFCLGAVLAWFLRDFGSRLLKHTVVWNDDCTDEKCYGRYAVFRISFALATFYGGLSLIMFGHKKHYQGYFRTRLQDSLWIIKIPILVGLLLLTLVLPNPFFLYYGYLSTVGAGFFIWIQVVLLIDFAYSWNDQWVNKGWYKPILILCGLIYSGILALIITMYYYFNCGLAIALITITFVAVIGFTLLSVAERVERGALLTSAVVTTYSTYMTFSALLSSTSHNCNPFLGGGITVTWTIAFGVIFALISICYSTIAAATTKGVFDMREKGARDSVKLLHSGEELEEYYNFSYFHLVFACGSMYFAMLYTGWNQWQNGIYFHFELGTVSMWVKIVSVWITIIFYVWSLIGPLMVPHRDWDLE